MLVSHDLMPAVWPNGGTLSSPGGPYLSEATWSALCKLAAVLSNEARRGVNGFGAFCRNKKPVLSPAEGGLDCRGETRQRRISRETRELAVPVRGVHLAAIFTGNPQDEFPIYIFNL
jgi:hypothetical protein